jgi:UDP-N-acetylmuramate: L-alanyl-gamma-D-glutamyl-meso-diaminopimelate ligase
MSGSIRDRRSTSDSYLNSVVAADRVFCYTANLGWNAAEALAPVGPRAEFHDDLTALIDAIAHASRPGDRVVSMSNGGFGGIHDKLLARLGVSS